VRIIIAGTVIAHWKYYNDNNDNRTVLLHYTLPAHDYTD